MSEEKKYCLELSFSQKTDGDVDNEVLMREFSSDGTIHALKTQVMTRHLTGMLNAMTEELTNFAISGGGEISVAAVGQDQGQGDGSPQGGIR